MTISSRIHEELFEPSAASANTDPSPTARLLIRMPVSQLRGAAPESDQRRQRRRRRRAVVDPNHLALAWSADEHERFLRGLELFPRGPWKDVAEYVGTRTVRQTMTHAQKYRQKIARHKRGLQTDATNKVAATSAAATSAAATPQAGPSIESEPETASLSVLDVSVRPYSAAALTSTPSVPDYRPILSPSSVDQLALGPALYASIAPVNAVNSLASFSPPASPRMLDSTDPLAYHIAEPIDCDANELAFLLDDSELDSLVIDDIIHSVIMQYLGPSPANDGFQVGAPVSRSFKYSL